MKRKIQFLIVTFVSFIVFNSCSNDDDGYLENYIEIGGDIHTINGGITSWGSEINDDLTWHFGSIVTLYGDGIDYDPKKRRFTGKGFVIRMRLHTNINGLGPGDYTYSESEETFTFNEAVYITNFDLDNDENLSEPVLIISGGINVEQKNKHYIRFDLTDSEGKSVKGYAVHHLF